MRKKNNSNNVLDVKKKGFNSWVGYCCRWEVKKKDIEGTLIYIPIHNDVSLLTKNYSNRRPIQNVLVN